MLISRFVRCATLQRNKTAGFTDAEREGFSDIMKSANLVDSFRHLYPKKEQAYTYWSYFRNARAKNIGWYVHQQYNTPNTHTLLLVPKAGGKRTHEQPQ